MLAKLTFSVLLGSSLFLSASFGQTPLNSPMAIPHTDEGVRPASFTFQDQEDGASADDYADQIKRLEMRLRELEDDIDKKLAAQSGSALGDAAGGDLGSRLTDLENNFETQGKSLSKVKDSLPGMLFHGHKNPKMQFFGRIHLDYWAFPNVDPTIYPLEGGDPQDRFNFRRLRIGVKGDLNDNMFYKYEGEFADGFNPSYRDAYLGFKNLPVLQTVIIGNQKRPYGLDHLNSSRHNIFIERPFIVEAFNQDSRRLGISSNGTTEDLGWNWRYGIFNQELTQTKSGYIGDHYQLEFAARIARTAWYDDSSGGRGYAHFALSGSAGEVDGGPGATNNQASYRTRPEARSNLRWLKTGRISGADETLLVGVESAINVGSFHVNGEFMRNNVDRLDAIGEDVAFEGGYVQASYIWTGEHHPWNRKRGTLDRLKPFENAFFVKDCDGTSQRGWGAWETAVRYSWADLNSFDVVGGEGSSWTFGLNWYLNSHARMQFNYINGEIENGPGGFGEYDIIGARIMVDF